MSVEVPLLEMRLSVASVFSILSILVLAPETSSVLLGEEVPSVVGSFHELPQLPMGRQILQLEPRGVAFSRAVLRVRRIM